MNFTYIRLYVQPFVRLIIESSFFSLTCCTNFHQTWRFMQNCRNYSSVVHQTRLKLPWNPWRCYHILQGQPECDIWQDQEALQLYVWSHSLEFHQNHTRHNIWNFQTHSWFPQHLKNNIVIKINYRIYTSNSTNNNFTFFSSTILHKVFSEMAKF